MQRLVKKGRGEGATRERPYIESNVRKVHYTIVETRGSVTEPGERGAMMSTNQDDDDTRFILYKIWCHGQSVAPPILGILCFFSSNLSTLDSFIIMTFLSIWPLFSFRAMQNKAFTQIIFGGLFVECIYSFILVKSPIKNGSGLSLLVFIAAALLMIETAAYLVVMWWNRAWFSSIREGETSQAILRPDGNVPSQMT